MEENGAAAGRSSVLEIIKNRLETNDPALTVLVVGNTPENQLENLSEEGWERAGSYIGSHSHLKMLMIAMIDGSPFGSALTQTFNKFFSGVARNRSIETLKLVLSNAFAHKFFDVMAPFFKNNPRLDYLEIQTNDGITTLPFPSSQLASTLQAFDSLQEFALDGESIHDEDVKRAIVALKGHRDLTTIHVHGAGRKSLSSLGKILGNSESQLKMLSLYDISIDDEAAFDFSSGLRANKSLRDFTLGFGDTHDDGPVKMTNLGWKNILNSLPNDTLETLDLLRNAGCNFNDSALHTLSNVLTRSKCLKSLNVCDSYDITDAGWRSFFRVLEHPNCKLERLELSGNNLHSDLGVHLTDALRNKSTLKELNLSGCELSDRSLRTFASLLREGQTGLEKLDLRENSINNATMEDFANSLLTNHKLKYLQLIDDQSEMEQDQSEMEQVWELFSQLLCNKQSIRETHLHSNHQLQFLGGYELMIPDDVRHYLQINRDNTKSGASRRKIIDVHFSGAKVDLECFIKMEAGVLPHAIAWVGKCSEAADLSLMLPLMLQCVPKLHSYFGASGKVEHESDEGLNAK